MTIFEPKTGVHSHLSKELLGPARCFIAARSSGFHPVQRVRMTAVIACGRYRILSGPISLAL